MTTEELKKKIDGLFFGLHSTNPGDINALKDILYFLVENAGGNSAIDAITISPTDHPNDEDTEAQAAAKLGITVEQLRSLFDGKLKYITIEGSTDDIINDGYYLCIFWELNTTKRLYFYPAADTPLQAAYNFMQGQDGGYYYSFGEV